jgi:uncharacterized phage-associated protein
VNSSLLPVHVRFLFVFTLSLGRTLPVVFLAEQKHKILRLVAISVYTFALMAYSSRAVANFLLDLASANSASIDPLKMQKLVYFAHGWHLALRDQPLLREPVEAWDHGPVIYDLYREFKRWGSGPIREPVLLVGSGGVLTVPSLDAECIWEPNADGVKSIIRRVWDVYSKWDGLQLSTLTHRAGTPWASIRSKYPDERSVEIPNEEIKRFFKAQASRSAPNVTA